MLNLVLEGPEMSILKEFMQFCRKNKQNAIGACGARKLYTWFAGTTSEYKRIFRYLK